MSKTQVNFDRATIQLTLPLSTIPSQKHESGSLRRQTAVKDALRTAFSSCGLSRELIADEMSRLTGERISVHQVNGWVAEGKDDRRFPLEYAEAVYVITGDIGVIQSAVSVSGCRVLGPKEVQMYELGRITAEDLARRKKRRAVLEAIGI